MVHTIFLLQVKADSPLRLRASLARKTQLLRGLPKQFEAPHRVWTALPPTVIGEQLLDLAGERLRGLLQGDPSMAADEPEERGDLEAWANRVDQAARSRDLPASTASRNPGSEKLVPPGIARRDHAPNSAPGRATVSSLKRQLNQYFASPEPIPPSWQNPTAVDTRPTTPSFILDKKSPSRVTVAAISPSNPEINRSWPDMFAHTLVGRLNRFVSGEAASSATLPITESEKGAGSMEVQNIFNIQVHPQVDGIASLQHLSDQVTEILREQAVQHGLDIT